MQVDVGRAARACGISSEFEIIDAIAAKAFEEIKEREDKQFIKETKVSMNQMHRVTVRKELMKLKRKDIVERFLACEEERLTLLDKGVDLAKSLDAARKGLDRRGEHLTKSGELMEFWREKAFKFQSIINDLMTQIASGDEL